eukprot:symbB.v1.2.009501.t1/scaffold590.1/size183855/13
MAVFFRTEWFETLQASQFRVAAADVVALTNEASHRIKQTPCFNRQLVMRRLTLSRALPVTHRRSSHCVKCYEGVRSCGWWKYQILPWSAVYALDWFPAPSCVL